MPGKGYITRLKRAAVYLRDGMRCVHCGRDVKPGRRNYGRGSESAATLDHCMSRADSCAVVTACWCCNRDLGEPPHPPPDLAQRLVAPLDLAAARELVRQVWGEPKPRRRKPSPRSKRAG